MAVVETLELRFQADTGRLDAALASLAAQLGSLDSALENSKSGMKDAISRLTDGAAEVLSACARACGAAGAMLAQQFSQGISGGAGAVQLSARNLTAAARLSRPDALRAAQAAGAALGQGFSDGISSRYGAVMAAANRLADAAANRIRSALQIHSPSKLTFALGGDFGAGFANGICASIRSVEAGAQALSLGASASLSASAPERLYSGQDVGLGELVRSAVDTALGDKTLVIPLTVDGMKLGEASIRGINRVTRSAGRLLLEI